MVLKTIATKASSNSISDPTEATLIHRWDVAPSHKDTCASTSYSKNPNILRELVL